MRSVQPIYLMVAAAMLAQAPAGGQTIPHASMDAHGRDDTPATRPAETRPADDIISGSAEPGAVQRALVRLYRIPLPARRPRDLPTASSVPADEESSRIAGAAPTVARPPTPVQADLGGDPGAGPESPSADTSSPGSVNVYVAPGDHGPGYYRPGGSGLTARQRRWSDYRYFGGRPSRYGYDREYYGRYGDDDDGASYRFGFLRGYDRGRFEARADERGHAVRALSGRRLQAGLEHLRAGDYRAAAAAFKLAAESNQGDPAAAIYAAHALFAIGRYRDAAGYLRHAFDMQPKIALLDYDLREDYGVKEDFQTHLAALEQALRDDPRNTDRLLVLAYVYSFSGQRDRADGLLREARRLGSGDRLIEQLQAGQLLPDVPTGPAATRPAQAR